MQNTKRYWLRGGIAFAVIILIFSLGMSYFGPSKEVVSLDAPSNGLILIRLLELFLGTIVFFPVGYLMAIIYVFGAIFFPFPPIIISLSMAFVNGMFWGWIYGKIKNRNKTVTTNP